MHIDNFIAKLHARRELTLRIFDGGGGGDGNPNPPYKPPVGKSTIKGSPGLITSTGGLAGISFSLLMPVFDSIFEKTYLAGIDPSNFNSEEACFYTFRQEDVMINRKVSVHLLFVTYREIDVATFTIGVRVYVRDTDSFKTSSRVVTIKPKDGRKVKFPSNTLRTMKVGIDVLAGERPQVFYNRLPNSGALSITRVMMVGKADEKDFI
ncbi:MAG TPA: hypothetical protein VNZ45_00480 [Bacteroidia bacterium]|jgi:hypothetical protein|nr:hypothetical protein [Bacteroidia bacterium]